MLTLLTLSSKVSVGIEGNSVSFLHARRQKAAGGWSCVLRNECQRRKRCYWGGWGYLQKTSSLLVMFSEVGSALGCSAEHPLSGDGVQRLRGHLCEFGCGSEQEGTWQ